MKIWVGVLISFVYSFIPLIWKKFAKEEAFFHRENYIIFGLLFFNIFSLSFLNWAVIKRLEIFFDMKLYFKMTIMSMLDPNFAVINKMEQKMPFILESSPQNLMQFINMV
jgi:hypothetical protein